MDNNSQYLTKESLQNLTTELETLRNKTIPDIARRIDEAKQQGDLSENAEYHQAREDMSWTQSRVQELDQLIQNAQIIEKSANHDTVSIGSTVTVKINGKTKDYTIVGPQEIDPSKGYISNESPLGQAFLKHKVKDKIEVTTPAGKNVYEISSIK
ncbi:MAG: transcription elongation factor GreA [Candidatus Magasanikbacteria bacterium]|nr:transcription elongation factor GreA [Candidatus Magasanikbacteria bacterium]